jgi:hypothetical protein
VTGLRSNGTQVTLRWAGSRVLKKLPDPQRLMANLGQVITWTLHYERFYIVFICQMICSGQRAKGKGQRPKGKELRVSSWKLESSWAMWKVENNSRLGERSDEMVITLQSFATVLSSTLKSQLCNTNHTGGHFLLICRILEGVRLRKKHKCVKKTPVFCPLIDGT